MLILTRWAACQNLDGAGCLGYCFAHEASHVCTLLSICLHPRAHSLTHPEPHLRATTNKNKLHVYAYVYEYAHADIHLHPLSIVSPASRAEHMLGVVTIVMLPGLFGRLAECLPQNFHEQMYLCCSRFDDPFTFYCSGRRNARRVAHTRQQEQVSGGGADAPRAAGARCLENVRARNWSSSYHKRYTLKENFRTASGQRRSRH